MQLFWKLNDIYYIKLIQSPGGRGEGIAILANDIQYARIPSTAGATDLPDNIKELVNQFLPYALAQNPQNSDEIREIVQYIKNRVQGPEITIQALRL